MRSASASTRLSGSPSPASQRLTSPGTYSLASAPSKHTCAMLTRSSTSTPSSSSPDEQLNSASETDRNGASPARRRRRQANNDAEVRTDQHPETSICHYRWLSDQGAHQTHSRQGTFLRRSARLWFGARFDRLGCLRLALVIARAAAGAARPGLSPAGRCP